MPIAAAQGGIYDVTDFVNLPLSGEESPAMVEQENLYPIELDGGKNEILSMESCGENLAVFISVNGRMTMRIVNPQTWETEHIVALLGWGGTDAARRLFCKRGICRARPFFRTGSAGGCGILG